MKASHRIICTLLFSFLLLLICILKFRSPTPASDTILSPSISFKTFANNCFCEEISTDPLTLHFLFSNRDYEKLLQSYQLNPYTDPASPNMLNKYKNRFEILQNTSVRMNTSDAYEKEILLWYTQKQAELASYSLFAEPLSPEQGLQTEYISLLTAYEFYDKKDILHYFTLLRSFPTWCNSVLDYEKSKKNSGYFMPYELALRTSASLETYASGIELFQEPFREKCMHLIRENLLTIDEYEELLETHNGILNSYVFPAYHKLATGLLQYADQEKQLCGLSYYDQGASYYQTYIETVLGASETSEEWKTVLQSEISKNAKDFEFIRKQALQEGYLFQDYTFPFSNMKPSLILKYLQKQFQSSFPAMPDELSLNIRFQKIPSPLLPYTAPAYYILSPTDALQNQTIYLQSDQINDPEMLFHFIHECFPGHMYQHIYSSIIHQKMQLSDYALLLPGIGFQEGWAIYCENWFAEQLLNMLPFFQKMGYSNTDSQQIIFLLQLMNALRKLQLSLFAYLDLCIHTENMDFINAYQLLKSYGFESPNENKEIYISLVGAPGSYLKYYAGYLKICSCKELAKQSWKQHYTELSFHRFLLTYSGAPFPILEKMILKKYHS